MTLWSIFRSPLMMGGDLPTLDPFTKSLLTNADVLAVNQHSTGNKVAYKQGDIRVWTAKAAQGRRMDYVAVFNLGDAPSTIHLKWDQVGLGTTPASARELWSGHTQTAPADLNVTLGPHASAIYGLRFKE
jgi:alpha-galactosidase